VPWALLVRLLVRVLAGLFLWRVTGSRRPGTGRSVPPQRASRLGNMPSASAIRQSAALGWHITAVAGFAAVAAVLVTAGTTLTVLSPRWLGIALLVVAVIAMSAAALEVRSLLRLVAVRRRERQAQALRSELS